MNEIYQNMLLAYDLSTDQAKRNATFEVNQQIILAGLYQGGFFEKAAFYGGTCLRIFHGLNRFSEDGSSDKVRGIPTQIYHRYMIDFP